MTHPVVSTPRGMLISLFNRLKFLKPRGVTEYSDKWLITYIYKKWEYKLQVKDSLVYVLFSEKIYDNLPPIIRYYGYLRSRHDLNAIIELLNIKDGD